MRSKMTTFASAATPIVRIRPAKPGSVSVTFRSRIAAVQERDVDAEADHGDHAEEAVEDEQEDRDDEQADERRRLRLLQRVLAERRRDVRALDLLELERQGAGLEDEREVLRLAELADVRDLAAAADPVRERRVGVVDLRERLDVAVEHDREVLRRLPEPAALVQPARDPLELVAPLRGEREADDRLADWSKSACVPDDFSSPPVISGMRLLSSGFVGSYLKR